MSFVLLISLFITGVVFGQHPGGMPGGAQVQKTIKGTLVDSITGNAISYASVAVYRMRDTSLAGGTITDDKGNFQVVGLSFGRYFLRITFVGYRPIEKSSIIITPQSPDVIDIGKVQIALHSGVLPEVVIEGTKPYIEMNLEKKVVNVEQDINVTGGTALDVLQTIPSVSVDMDGNVSYRGSQNVTILIDGRPAHFAGSRKAMLEQIPANMIQSVELISNPSAKYDPEGTAGIINIVLKQRKTQKFSSQLNANVNSLLGYSVGGMVSFGKGKTNVLLGADHRYDIRYGSGKSERFNYLSEPYYILQKINSKAFSTGNSFRFNFDYFPAAGLTIGLSSNLNVWNSDDSSQIKVEEKDSELLYRRNYININDNAHEHYMLQFALNVLKKFSTPGNQLQMDVNYSSGHFDGLNHQLRTFYSNDWTAIDSLLRMIEVHSAFSKNSTLVSKLDYSYPFNEKSKVETGLHYTGRMMNNDSKYYKGLETHESLPYDSLRSNVFEFKELIYASYVIFSHKFEKIAFSGGIRYEHVETEPILKGDTNDYFRSYRSFYPSGSVTYSLSKGKDLQISYSKRVNRPSFHSLSPFVDYSDAPNLRGGNPYLKPEYIHSVELSYMHLLRKGSIMPSIFYKHTIDLISRYRQNYQDTFSLVTYQNLANANTYGIELVFNYVPHKSVRLNGSGNLVRTHLNATNLDPDLTQEGFDYGGSFMANINLIKNLDIQLSSFYRSGNIIAQGRRSGMFSVNAGVRYKLLNDKLIASLNVRDIFNTMGFRVRMEDKNFRFSMDRRWESRILTAGIIWQINPERMPRERDRRRNMNREDSSTEYEMF